ncbi:MAG: dihydroorotase [Deltaproteobacteria bacterium]|nr:dihydroorotase [Deltaproteobacteria bacterium]
MKTDGAIAIEGGRLIDPAAGLDGRHDLLLDGGVVRAVDKPGAFRSAPVERRIDARGRWVVPGLIDLHCHLREPGYEYKETVASGAAAAVAGGFTAVACMANTDPVNDSAAVTRFILERAAAAALARVHPIGAVSQGLRGERLAEIGEMRAAGIVAVSDDGQPVADAALMRHALEYCRMFGIAVIDHAEDPGLCAGGAMHEGATSHRLGLKGIPAAAEEAMVGRDLLLAQLTGGRLHVAHASTRGTVELVRAAKARGVRVTAEVTPHHLTLTDEAVAEYDGNAKMKPPLRTADDRRALAEGLADGTIDAIATDHAPHHRDEKAVEFEAAAFGVVGLETALALSLRLVEQRVLDPARWVRRLSTAPAEILGVAGGTLRAGAPADVVLIDPDAEWTVEAAGLRSKSKNSPFLGWAMKGRASCTIVAGRVVYEHSTAASERRDG